ncbi:hypothetical protein [uncultured Duncaniella sp.]|uniref:hypothetical protein n=1 Tax=uncultured Duncaniella sp. TaxID=2768039 RepID=UPI0026335A54|nr:hypothetical protein [uncultured Duncaniella sp.]
MKQSSTSFSQSSTSFSKVSDKTPHSKVSKKFHAYIHGRVREACAVYGQPALAVVASGMIDGYIADGVMPPADSDAVCMMIFTILRPEIDRAIERSASARRRAAVRRGDSAVMEAIATARMTSNSNNEEVPVCPDCDYEASICPDCDEPDYSSIPFPNRRARRLFMNDMKRRARTRIKPLTVGS